MRTFQKLNFVAFIPIIGLLFLNSIIEIECANVTKLYPLASPTAISVLMYVPGIPSSGCASFVKTDVEGCNGASLGTPGARVPATENLLSITTAGPTSFKGTGLYKLCYSSVTCGGGDAGFSVLTTANYFRVATVTTVTKLVQANLATDIYLSGTTDGDLVAFVKTSSNCNGAFNSSFVVSGGKVTVDASIEPGLAYVCYSTNEATQDSQFYLVSVATIRFLSSSVISDIRPNAVPASGSNTIYFEGGANSWLVSFLPISVQGCQGASEQKNQISSQLLVTVSYLTTPGSYKLCLTANPSNGGSDSDFIVQPNIILQVYSVSNPSPLTVSNAKSNVITIPGSSGKYVAFSLTNKCYSASSTKILSFDDTIVMPVNFLPKGKYFACFGGDYSTADYHYTSSYSSANFHVITPNQIEGTRPDYIPLSTNLRIRLEGSPVQYDSVAFVPSTQTNCTNAFNHARSIEAGGYVQINDTEFFSEGNYKICYSVLGGLSDDDFVLQDAVVNVVDIHQMTPTTIEANKISQIAIDGVNQGDLVSFVTTKHCLGAFNSKIAVNGELRLFVQLPAGIYTVCYGPSASTSDMDFVDLGNSLTLTVLSNSALSAVSPSSLMPNVRSSLTLRGLKDGDLVAIVPFANSDCNGAYESSSQVSDGEANFNVGVVGKFKFCFAKANATTQNDFVEQSITINSIAISIPSSISELGGNLFVNGSTYQDFISFVNQPNCVGAHNLRIMISENQQIGFPGTYPGGMYYVCYASSAANGDNDYVPIDNNVASFRVILTNEITKIYPLIASITKVQGDFVPNSIVGNVLPGDYVALISSGETCSGAFQSKTAILTENKVDFSEISGISGLNIYRMCLGDKNVKSDDDFVLQNGIQIFTYNFSGISISPSTAKVNDEITITIPGGLSGDYISIVPSNQNCVSNSEKKFYLDENRKAILAGNSVTTAVPSTYYLCYGIDMDEESENYIINLRKSISFI